MHGLAEQWNSSIRKVYGGGEHHGSGQHGSHRKNRASSRRTYHYHEQPNAVGHGECAKVPCRVGRGTGNIAPQKIRNGEGHDLQRHHSQKCSDDAPTAQPIGNNILFHNAAGEIGYCFGHADTRGTIKRPDTITEGPTLRTVLHMRVNQPLVDARIFTVAQGRECLLPSFTIHRDCLSFLLHVWFPALTYWPPPTSIAGMTDALRPYLAAAAEGDNVAMGELVRRTQPAVWRMCSALGSGDDVEDLVQETYLRAFRSIGQFRGESAVQTWFLSIARHVCADQIRRSQRQRRLLTRIVQSADRRNVDTSDTSVSALLADVAFERREAFVLTQLLGLSYDEASDVVGCPVGTIRSRVSRAKADMLALVREAEAI